MSTLDNFNNSLGKYLNTAEEPSGLGGKLSVAIENKKSYLGSALEAKKQILAPNYQTTRYNLSDIEIDDADTLIIPDGQGGTRKLRHAYAPGTKKAFDAYEVAHPNNPEEQLSDSKRYYQRVALGKKMGVHPMEVTDEMIFAEGDRQKQMLKNALFAGYEDPANAQVDITHYNERDIYDRELAGVANPLTKKDLIDIYNNPEENAGYTAPFNAQQSLEDAQAFRKANTKTKGELGNRIAQAYSGLTRAGGWLVNAVPHVINYGANVAVGEEDRKSYSDLRNKEKERDRLTTILKDPDIGNALKTNLESRLASDEFKLTKEERKLINSTDYTILRGVENLEENWIKKVNKAVDFAASTVDRVDERRVMKQNEKYWKEAANDVTTGIEKWSKGDKLEGAGDIVSSLVPLVSGFAKTFTEDPGVVLGTFIESVPHMILASGGKVVATAASLGMAADIAAKGHEDFIKEYGREPDAGEQGIILAAGITSALAEKIGATGVFGKAAPGQSVAKQVGKAFAEETITEGYQGIAEQYAGKQDIDKVNLGQAYGEAVLGGLSGGGARTAISPVQLAKEALGASSKVAGRVTPKKAKDALQSATQSLKQAKEKTEAIRQGDYTQVTDVDSPAWTLQTAVQGISDAYRKAKTVEEKRKNINDFNKQFAKAQKDLANAAAVQVVDPTPEHAAIEATQEAELKSAIVIRDNLAKDFKNIVGKDETTDVGLDDVPEPTPPTSDTTESSTSTTRRTAESRDAGSVDKVADKFQDFLSTTTDIKQIQTEITSRENYLAKGVHGPLLDQIEEEIQWAQNKITELEGGTAPTAQVTPSAPVQQEIPPTQPTEPLGDVAGAQADDYASYIQEEQTQANNAAIEPIPEEVTSVALPDGQSITINDPITYEGSKYKVSKILDNQGVYITPVKGGKTKLINPSTVFTKETPKEKVVKDKPNMAAHAKKTKQIQQKAEIEGIQKLGSNALNHDMVRLSAKETRSEITEAEKFTLSELKKEYVKRVRNSEEYKKQVDKKSKRVISEELYQKSSKLWNKVDTSSKAGADPRIIIAGAIVAAYHIENGVRSFAKFSKVMLEELGEAAKPYLKGWFEAATKGQSYNYDTQLNALESEEFGAPTLDRIKELSVIKYKDIKARVARDEFIRDFTDKNINKKPTKETHEKFLSTLFDFYEENGWPSVKDTVLQNSVHQLANTKMKAAKRTPKSVLGLIPDFIDYYSYNPTRNKINKKYNITEEEEAVLDNIIEFRDAFEEVLEGITLPGETQRTNKEGSTGTASTSIVNKDLHHIFRDKDNNLDQNLITAAAITGYSYLATQASGDLRRMPSTINAILGRADDAPVDTAANQTLGQAGVLLKKISDQLGPQVLSQMNVSFVDGMDGRLHYSLEKSLGLLVVDGLINMGHVKIVSMENQSINNLKDREGDKISTDYTDTTTNFIKLTDTFINKDNIEKPGEEVEKIIGEFKIGKHMLKNLFDAADPKVFPSNKASTQVDDKFKHTYMDLPPAYTEGINKAQGVAQGANLNPIKLMQLMSKDAFMRMSGTKTDEEVHELYVESQHAINEALDTEYMDAKEFIGTFNEDLSDEFYYTFFGAKNARIHPKEQAINTQNSTMHRFLFGAKSWEEIIHIGTEEESFLRVALMESLGTMADKRTHGMLLDEFNKTVMDIAGRVNPTYAEAVKIINDALDNDTKPTSAQERVLEKAVSNGGEKIHSFTGLINIARYAKALQNDDNTVETTIFREIDGTTNGPSSMVFQLSTNTKEAVPVLRASGWHFDTDKPIEYAPWYQESGNWDNYQALTLLINEELDKKQAALFDKKGQQARMRALRYLMSDLITTLTKEEAAKLTAQGFNATEGDIDVTKAGRNFSKHPLMVTAYGAAINTVMRAVQDQSVINLYNSLMQQEKKAKAEEKKLGRKGAEYQVLVHKTTALEVLFSKWGTVESTPKEMQTKVNYYYNGKGFRTFNLLNRKQMMEVKKQNPAGKWVHSKWITKEQYFRNQISKFYKPAVETAIDEKIGDTITSKDYANGAMRLMNEIFSELFDQRIRQFMKDNSDGGDYRYPDRKEYKQIVLDMIDEGLFPSVAGVHSTSLKDEIQVVKEEVLPRKTGKEKYKVNHERKEDTPFYAEMWDVSEDKEVNIREKKDIRKSIGGHISMPTFVADIGVSGIPLLIQGLDGAIQIKLLGSDFDILNIHDAAGSSVLKAKDEGIFANKTYIDSHNNYSVMSAINDSLVRLLETTQAQDDIDLDKDATALRTLINEKLKSKPIKIKLKGESKKLGLSSIDKFMESWGEQLKAVNTNRELLLSHTWGVDQFPSTGSISIFHKRKASANSKKEAPAQAEKLVNDVANEEDIQGSQENEIYDFVQNFLATEDHNIDTTTSVRILEDLKNIGNVTASTQHQEHLENILHDLINPGLLALAGNNFELHLEKDTQRMRSTSGAIQGEHIYVAAAEGLQKTAVDISPQEVYVHELLHAFSKNMIENNQAFGNEVRRLFRIAERVVTPEDFITNGAPHTPANLAAAQARYDYIFKSKKGYLHEFFVFGLSNEKFIEALSRADNKPTRAGYTGGVLSGLKVLFFKIIDTIAGLTQRSKGKTVDIALRNLARDITAINNSSQSKIDKTWNYGWGKVNGPAMAALSEFIYKPYIRSARKVIEAKKGPVATVAAQIYTLPHNIMLKQYRETVNDFAYGYGLTMDNMGYNLLNEIAGATAETVKFHKLLRDVKHSVDAARERVVESVETQTLFHFDELNPLTDDDWMAVNAGLLKTDVSGLAGIFTHAQLVDFYRSDTKLKREITKRENAILSEYTTNGWHYVNYTESLGTFMATGIRTRENMMLNAHKIANLTGKANPVFEGDLRKARELIDTLATLHAIRETPMDHRRTTANIMEHESSRGIEMNGVDFLLGVHDQFKKDSLTTLFDGNPSEMIKGFTHEMYDTFKTMKIAPYSERDMLKEDGGFVPVGPVGKDPYYAPQKNQQWIYVSSEGLLERYVTGIMGLTNTRHKGTLLVDLEYQDKTTQPYKAAYNKFFTYKRKATSGADRHSKGRTRPHYDAHYLLPITDLSGDIVNYRYTMNEAMKTEELGKRDLAYKTMARMAASIIDKPETNKGNREYIEMAKKDFDDYHADNPRGYISIGPNVANKKHREYYRLMPETAKRDVKEVWGSDTMIIREDLLGLAMGFRKASFTDYLDQLTGNRLPAFMKHTMRLAGALWQAIITRAKRNVVMFLPAVLLNNIFSNLVISLIVGVPPVYLLKKQMEAVKALQQYDKDMKKHDYLERKIAIAPNHSKKAEYQVRLDRLKADMKNNVVSKLIDDGLFQRITEDVTADSTDIEQAFTNIIPGAKAISDKLGDKIPGFVKEAYKLGVLHKDTSLARMLTNATQYSDFVARYALYSYRTERQNVAPDQAVEEAVDIFINYDVPTSKEMQWLNDMGILMFTKFLFRIQRVLARAFRDAPDKVIASGIAQYATGVDAAGPYNSFIGVHPPYHPGIDKNIDDAFTWNVVESVDGYTGGLLRALFPFL